MEMTDLVAFTRNTSVDRIATGWTNLRATPDGALYRVDYGFGLGVEGRTFAANMGLVTTPLATAATIEDASHKASALREIAEQQAKAGDVRGALETTAAIPDASHKALLNSCGVMTSR